MSTYWPDHLWPTAYWAGNYWNALDAAAVLSTTEEGAFPDSPGTPPRSLRADLVAGASGQFIEHHATVAMPVLHHRFVVSPTMPGGAVVVAQGLDSAQAETWRLTYDAAIHTIRLTLRDGQRIETPLVSGLTWHSIEIGIDTESGDARLWVNGLENDTSATVTSQVVADTLRLGVIEKHDDATGSLGFDAWQVGSQYLGPPMRPPVRATADDPARWLVLYNIAWPGAGTWAQRYVEHRGVPYANLLGLSLTTTETIDTTTWDALRTAVTDYLDRHDPAGEIVGILVGAGVPGQVDMDDGNPPLPTSSLLSTLRMSPAPSLPTPTPLPLETRPTASVLQGAMLTARMDAVDSAAALTWLDAAADPLRVDWRPLPVPDFYVTAHTDRTAETGSWIDSWAAWAGGLSSGRTRMRIRVTEDLSPPTSGWPSALTNDGLFWGWVPATVPPDYFGIAGPRGFAFPVLPAAATGASLRSEGTDWLRTMRSAGYLAIAATTGPTSEDDLPNLAAFSDALVNGWTLGEAWFAAQSVLGNHGFLAGDPLMSLTLPAAGWDVYAADNLEAVSASAPLARLHGEVTSFALPENEWPNEGANVIYMLRRIDSQGHAEAGSTAIRLADDGGQPVVPLQTPIWPPSENDVDTHGGWPIAVHHTEMRVDLVFDSPMGRLQITAVELQAKAADNIVTIEQWSVGRERGLTWCGPLPDAPTAFRWRLASADGRECFTTWSEEVLPNAPAGHDLQLLENRP